jgi:hypothetical protein
VSVAFVVVGLLYSFVWAPATQHQNYWVTPGDLWVTLQVAVQVDHGHISSMYVRHSYLIDRLWLVTSFQTFPGIVAVLSPVAALTSALHLTRDIPPFANVFVYPKAWLLLGPYTLLMSTVPIFACDALAERLGARVPKRWLLAVAEAVALWQVILFKGHPEDALAVGMLLYAMLFAFDSRWQGAGWLFGVALAFQPLVVVALPVLLAVSGTKKWRGFLVRIVIPPIAIIIVPLITNFSATFTAFTQQPNYPSANYDTPWTSLAPVVHIYGIYAVASGPGRVVAIVLSCAIGWWASRWRQRPELVVWAAAAALALRCFTESVMDSYYLWPTLAVVLVACSSGRVWRFASVTVAVVFVSVSSQWAIGWLSWWVINLMGLSVALIIAMQDLSFNPAQSLRLAMLSAIRQAEERSRSNSRAPSVQGARVQKRQRPKPQS